MSGVKGAIVLGFILIAALIAGWWTAPQEPEQQRAEQQLKDASGVEMFSGGQLNNLAFINEYGEPVELTQLRGRWTLMFFGYTYCPDICPMTLMHLSKLMKRLTTEEREQLNVVLVSVDPQRDQPENMSQYMDYFNPDFMALTGNPDNMKTLAARLNAFYARVDREDGGYLMDHSANIVLLSPELTYRGYIEPPHDPARMAPLVRALLSLPR